MYRLNNETFIFHIAAQPKTKDTATICEYPFNEESENVIAGESQPERPRSFVPQHVNNSSLLDSSSDENEDDEEEVLYRDDTFISHEPSDSEGGEDSSPDESKDEPKEVEEGEKECT